MRWVGLLITLDSSWSIKDVMNHIAAWQEAAIHAIHVLEAGAH
jgi:hypothetical protein